ncbi:sensor histidine kinase [Clostridium oryzae]|uniref:histidine kinase n=1 Tax=Clostridium oryzae TaxID=1450648 RepID=A0A1V4IPW7_9CLOT|nr:sensor histidine kinase [Clostridium oryzae]OPJ61953.1 sensor histidine kinase YehU [Clostridium oryzae]
MKIKFFSQIKLMHKFLLSYFLLIIIPLLLLSMLTYQKVSTLIESYITYSSKQAFDQTNLFLSYKLYRFLNVCNVVGIDDNLISILAKNPYEYDIHDQIKDMTNLRKFLDSFQDTVDIYKVRVYLNDVFTYSSENVNILGNYQAKHSRWYGILKQSGKKNLWCPSSYLDKISDTDPNLLSVVTSIRNPNDYSQDIGFVRIDFQKGMIDQIIKNANTIDKGLTYIQNSRGTIVTASNMKLLKKYKITTKLAMRLSNNTNKLSTVNIHGNDCLVESSIIANTDWYMVTIIPTDSIFSKIRSIRNDLILLLLIIGTIAFTLAFYFSNSLTKRIYKLIKAMRKVHEGNLNSFVNNTSSDEIGELIENYNYMLSQMGILIEKQYKSGKAVKNAELKALQAQINPHFLYNTLDMINWLSYKNMNKEISEAVKNLAKFYKLSLNKGKAITKIKDELTHVSLYVEIQNMRYSNRINLSIDIDEKIKDYDIPKITLQPIVENSIIHGILGRGNECGNISITSETDDDIITIFVKDDGIGIPEDMLDKILSGEINSQKGSGYGLKNIDDRIKLSYGEQYGLTYKSVLSEGTTVEIKIPAVKCGDSHNIN